MDWAQRAAELSYAKRRKVGAVIVKDDTVISYGYNGMPAGWDNNCETTNADGSLTTRVEVLHAESNAIAKLAKSPNSGLDADLFVTHSPCIHCAKLIFQSGITRVYFNEHYRDDEGIRFLKNSNIDVIQLDIPISVDTDKSKN